ncbi:MAG: DUF2798 domain-containing protein [Pseudomonadota bacterium]
MTRQLFAHIVFSAITSGLMSALVCGLATYNMGGLSKAFMHVWFGGWLFAWPVAFGVLVLIGPFVRSNVYKACRCPLSGPSEARMKEEEV